MTEALVYKSDRASWSRVNSYDTCSWQFFLERVAHVDQRQSWPRFAGTAVHEATELFDLEGELPGDNWFDEAVAKYEAATDTRSTEWDVNGRASKAYPNKEDASFWRDTLPVMVGGYVKWRLDTGWQIATIDGKPAVEVPVEFMVDDTRVLGYVDRVFVTHTGAVGPWDLKTGSQVPQTIGQLGFYRRGLAETYGFASTTAGWWKGRSVVPNFKGETKDPNVPVLLSELDYWSDDLIDLKVRMFRKSAEAGLFTPKEQSMCNACSVRDSCVVKGGSFSSASGVTLAGDSQ